MEIKTNELERSWRSLYKELKQNKKINFELFEAAYTQTYALLKECAAKKTLDKHFVRLIAEAYLFASVHDDFCESRYLAATVLTERMLNSFAFQAAAPEETATVYLMEAREEVQLSFGDVNESVSRLISIFDNAFWKKLSN